MRCRIASLLLTLALAGCSPASSDDIEQIELRLVEGADCLPETYADIFALSVTVYGQQGSNVNDLCLDAPRCLFVDELTSVQDIETVLQDEPQPLVDVAADGARQVAVHGHVRGCFSYGGDNPELPVLCGFADLASASQGELEIVLRCPCEEIPPLALCE